MASTFISRKLIAPGIHNSFGFTSFNLHSLLLSTGQPMYDNTVIIIHKINPISLNFGEIEIVLFHSDLNDLA